MVLHANENIHRSPSCYICEFPKSVHFQVESMRHLAPQPLPRLRTSPPTGLQPLLSTVRDENSLTPQAAPSIFASLRENASLFWAQISCPVVSTHGSGFWDSESFISIFLHDSQSHIWRHLSYSHLKHLSLPWFFKVQLWHDFKPLHYSSHAPLDSVLAPGWEPGRLQKLLDWSSCFILKRLQSKLEYSLT